ncbi:putative FBD-associated F-box protein At1g55030 [Oryza brachyantha]|uniref:putative FBD-associated F-box protein At1g55030 n=1 Tax=Oryza brachyantha TaxID=4533 RepID=UPI001ADCB7D7|nr:putative FBD-associated F-box protein At1g55030 [Oryza brachyantha]
MATPTPTPTSSRHRRHARDRLSALPDGILARVLSHLGSVDAACAAILSRRWRHLPAAVPVVDLVEPEGDQICAVVGRHSATTPIRRIRVDEFWPPHDALDQAVAVAAATGGGLEEFDVKLRYPDCSNRRLCPFRGHPGASADFGDDAARESFVATPPQILRCDTLRRLRLTNWRLDVPADGVVSMPSLESASLKRVAAAGEAVQRLVSGCPNLADLTLDQCPGVDELVVASPRLDSFAITCCHNARRVVLRTERLRTLRYKGALPGDNFFALAGGCANVLAMTIEICGSLAGKPADAMTPITKLIARCTGLTFLHIHLRPAMAYHGGAIARALHHLPHLRQLALKGVIKDDRTVRSISTLLRSTPGLDVLTLSLVRPQKPKPYYLGIDSDDDEDDYSYSDDDDAAAALDTRVRLPPALWEAQVECLQRLRKMKLLNYKGTPCERMLARFLLSKASALQQLEVTLPAKTAKDRVKKLTDELRFWRADNRTRLLYFV